MPTREVLVIVPVPDDALGRIAAVDRRVHVVDARGWFDVEMREAPCAELVYRSPRKKRIPLDECIGAVAEFCDCRVWRDKGADGAAANVNAPALAYNHLLSRGS